MRSRVEHSPQLGCAVLFFLCRLQAVRFAPNHLQTNRLTSWAVVFSKCI